MKTPLYGQPIPRKRKTSHGYLKVIANGHPLARGKFREYEHRIIYYDACGKGPFLCYWCDEEVTWANLHIDHLDEDGTNNDISNLVASCIGCNVKRGRYKTAAKQSKWITYDGKTMNARQWAECIGITRHAFKMRIRDWGVDRACSEPRHNRGLKHQSPANKTFGPDYERLLSALAVPNQSTVKKPASDQ